MKNLSVNKQQGFTLVEVLASIVLISLIVIVSISFFIHSQRTQISSEQIADATYVVQSEMENIENLSRRETLSDAITLLQNDLHYQLLSEKPYILTKNVEALHIKVRIFEDQNTPMYRIIMEAFENDKLKAKMETKKEWGLEGAD